MKSLYFAITLMAIALGAQAANPRVEMKTSQGTIVLELDADKAPISVDNFVKYTKEGFYNGTIFHRVIDGFMIQGGGFTRDMTEKPTHEPIANEAKNGLKNLTGTIAMARTPNPNSATAQFFINLVDNTNLDYPSFDGWGYAVFGKVVSGLDVVQKIGKTATANTGRYQNVPVTPIVIEFVKLLPDSAKKEKTP